MYNRNAGTAYSLDRLTCCGKSPFSHWEFMRTFAARCNGKGSLLACSTQIVRVRFESFIWIYYVCLNRTKNVKYVLVSALFSYTASSKYKLDTNGTNICLWWKKRTVKPNHIITTRIGNPKTVTCPASMRDIRAQPVLTTWDLLPSRFEYTWNGKGKVIDAAPVF